MTSWETNGKTLQNFTRVACCTLFIFLSFLFVMESIQLVRLHLLCAFYILCGIFWVFLCTYFVRKSHNFVALSHVTLDNKFYELYCSLETASLSKCAPPSKLFMIFDCYLKRQWKFVKRIEKMFKDILLPLVCKFNWPRIYKIIDLQNKISPRANVFGRSKEQMPFQQVRKNAISTGKKKCCFKR